MVFRVPRNAPATFYPGCHLPGAHKETKAGLELECDCPDQWLILDQNVISQAMKATKPWQRLGNGPQRRMGAGRPGAAGWVGQNQAYPGHSSGMRSRRKKKSTRKPSWTDPHHSDMTQTPNVNSLRLPQGSVSGPESQPWASTLPFSAKLPLRMAPSGHLSSDLCLPSAASARRKP